MRSVRTRGLCVRDAGVAAVFAALLAAPLDARAYCRTTSSPAAAGYNPAQAGTCWTSADGGAAIGLAWPRGSHVPYSLVSTASTQVNLADATAVAHLAFAAWAGSAGAADAGPLCQGGEPNVLAYDNGPVAQSVANSDCGLNPCADTVHDPNHLIVFRDNGWPYTDPVSTLALTTVTYGVITGTIYDADIEINSDANSTPPFFLTTQEPPPPSGYPANTYDLQAVLTHEAGHFLGMAHATDARSVMYAYYASGSIHLTPDDIDGICAIYPPLPPAAHGCAFAPRPSGGWLLAVATSLVFLGRRHRGLPPVRS